MVAKLGAVLAEETAREPEHERAHRSALRTAVFAADVLAAWDAQEMHRGKRSTYGLTKEHAAYARRVRAWALYETDVAAWMREPFHRETLQHMQQCGRDDLNDRELSVIALRPSAPDVPRPEHCHAPPHWPEHPDAVGASEAFFGAVQA